MKTTYANSVLRQADSIAPLYERMSRMQQLVMEAGWRWPEAASVLEKAREELDEVAAAMRGGNRAEMVDELGDLIYMSTMLCHYLEIDPAEAIASVSAKLEHRYGYIEQQAQVHGYTVANAPRDIRYQWYVDAKESEKQSA